MYACGRRSRDGGNEGEQMTRPVRTRRHKRPGRAHHLDPGDRTQHHRWGTLALFPPGPDLFVPCKFWVCSLLPFFHFHSYVFVDKTVPPAEDVRATNTLIRDSAVDHTLQQVLLHVLRTGRVLA